MVLGYAGPKVPSLCPARWPSPQACHPIITLLVSGGGWARASSPASKASRTLRDSGGGRPCAWTAVLLRDGPEEARAWPRSARLAGRAAVPRSLARQ